MGGDSLLWALPSPLHISLTCLNLSPVVPQRKITGEKEPSGTHTAEVVESNSEETKQIPVRPMLPRPWGLLTTWDLWSLGPVCIQTPNTRPLPSSCLLHAGFFSHCMLISCQTISLLAPNFCQEINEISTWKGRREKTAAFNKMGLGAGKQRG